MGPAIWLLLIRSCGAVLMHMHGLGVIMGYSCGKVHHPKTAKYHHSLA
jgi:hypothetical protein